MRLRRVEPDAFSVLYERYVPIVLAFSVRRVHDQTQAEDVTAQTFLQALGALPRYQPCNIPIRNWLLTIAANVIRDTYRRSDALTRCVGNGGGCGGDNRDDTTGIDLQDMNAAAAITACADTEAFDGLVETLPDAQREVIRLRFVADLSIAETARYMARSEGAIKALQTRALNTLRRSKSLTQPQQPWLHGKPNRIA